MLSEDSEGVWERLWDESGEGEREEGKRKEEERGRKKGGIAETEMSPHKDATGPWPSMPLFQRPGPF